MILPDELNEDVRWILGRPNFACAGIAQLLRANGEAVKNRAEDEQAAAIYWMLKQYEKHGADWRKHAEIELAKLAKTYGDREAAQSST